MTEISARRTSEVDPVVISLAGEFDIARESEILDLVMALGLPPGTTVHLDMGNVTFVDSGGLHALLKAQGYLEGGQCKLRIVNPQQQLQRVIELARLDKSLTVDLAERAESREPRRSGEQTNST